MAKCVLGSFCSSLTTPKSSATTCRLASPFDKRLASMLKSSLSTMNVSSLGLITLRSSMVLSSFSDSIRGFREGRRLLLAMKEEEGTNGSSISSTVVFSRVCMLRSLAATSVSSTDLCNWEDWGFGPSVGRSKRLWTDIRDVLCSVPRNEDERRFSPSFWTVFAYDCTREVLVTSFGICCCSLFSEIMDYSLQNDDTTTPSSLDTIFEGSVFTREGIRRALQRLLRRREGATWYHPVSDSLHPNS